MQQENEDLNNNTNQVENEDEDEDRVDNNAEVKVYTEVT